MNDKNEILLSMFQEHCTQGRQHESQRSTVTGILLSISAGLVALVSLDDRITLADLPLGLFIVGIGLFGALFSAKLYERFRMHMEQARAFRDALDEAFPDARINKLKASGEERHKKRANLDRLHLHTLWIFLNLFIGILGVLIVIMAIGS